jgi:hypothetical protein
MALVSRAESLGRPDIWNDHISVVPWFGEWPGFGAYGQGQVAYGQQPMMYQPGMQQPYYVQQQPGQSLMIQPGANGMPPTVTTV